ncbi:hypothetical protein HPB48_021932 [Haemaphysalis longicornis]|uniref:Uncharacterized protein n=1 Tax=Haemaphysalis longicornis TaxID=44386 RepID=A0A9J6GVZ8_HAELO|nr:hypothetical protein HPB48_021932 [Haemaphysalis longicornis]
MVPGATVPPDVSAGRTPPLTAPLASSSCTMHVVEVVGETVSPEHFENDAGLLLSHRKRSRKAFARLNLAQNDSQRQPGTGSTASVIKTPETKRKEAIRLPRQPALPKGDIKIVLRPRDGLDNAKMNDAQIRDGAVSATAIKKEEAEDDLLRTIPKQNIIILHGDEQHRNTSGLEGHRREGRIAEKRSRSASFPAAERVSTGGHHRSRSKSRRREAKSG